MDWGLLAFCFKISETTTGYLKDICVFEAKLCVQVLFTLTVIV